MMPGSLLPVGLLSISSIGEYIMWLHCCIYYCCMNFETIIGVTASACTAASLLPQLTKILKERKAESVSLWMLVVLFIGLGLWVYYGLLKKDIIIIISNIFSLIINILLVIFAIKYKKE